MHSLKAVLPSPSRRAQRHKCAGKHAIRPGTPLSLEDARRLVKGYVDHYNDIRLNSAFGYITPKGTLPGHQQEIQADRVGNWSGEGIAEESPPAGRVTDETDYFRLAD